MKRKNAPRCIDNIFEVFKLFMNNSRVSTKMISDKLAISQRSAQRYIQDISSHLGVFENDDNTYSYFELAKFDNIYFKNEEQLLLFSLIDSGKATIPKEKHATLEKLKKVFMVDKFNERSTIIGEKSINFLAVSEQVKPIDDAIRLKSCISFYYTKKAKNYTISPYRVLYNDGFWYLLGGNENGTRLFRIDYMEKIEEDFGTTHVMPDDLKVSLDEVNNIWALSGEAYYVEIKFDDEIKDYFTKRKIFADLIVLSDSPFIAKVKVHNEMELFVKLARFTPYYEIISENEREYFINNFEIAIKRHKKVEHNDIVCR